MGLLHGLQPAGTCNALRIRAGDAADRSAGF